MNEQVFRLRPFPPSGHLPDLKITGRVTRSTRIISVSYSLVGPLSKIEIPAPAKIRARKDRLWEETCFELFLGLKNSSQYWEFNLSTAGHWNVYRFEDYRRAMEEERAFTSLSLKIQRHPDTFQLSMDFNPDTITPAKEPLEAAISAVIKLSDGELTHWALTHPGPKADFHRRASFLIEL